MLIIPLHHPLTRATFPFVTALLILVNAWVFFGLQSGDQEAIMQAQRQYQQAGLARYEMPAYQRHLLATHQSDAAAELGRMPVVQRSAEVARRTLTDVEFITALRTGALFDNASELEAWKPLRAAYDARLDEVFTLRHLLRSSEIDPGRMLTAAFLHGGAMHLVGNMLFLLALGLLVEGALGPGRFLAVYLLGAFASSAVSLLWRWGEAGGGLGASGAVAALMGVFCVVWGRQPVRFFYWFGVVFDYVRAPAIWLLPAWLGWEVYNLLANDDIGIGFDAHAGGIVSGAIMGGVLVGFGQVRQTFISTGMQAETDGRWEQAQAHLGRMQLAEAESLLAAIARDEPDRLDVAVMRYRVARNGGREDLARQRGRAVLDHVGTGRDEIVLQSDVLRELDRAGVGPSVETRLELARRWLQAGALEAVELALLPMDAPTATTSADDPGHAPAQALLWFRLALAYRDRQLDEAQRRALQQLVERHPRQPQAEKARLLLGEMGVQRPSG
ncbi:rhomboid family membrane protein [Lysobacter concretionis Ko07 = DSM 16239]|uniref:Rhomboid family membrane protein n=1 Tax=Lysobacter concretionis Ko07 = DSM 16239 TaxID=1122185 RepID=A0A0A0ELV9_9GAMM|nr:MULTISPECIES: rhomboid family intramembrane serine protease [Lysobacter]KGM51986.1 rhomboid family membrane protein [Lysobacter concretionis Ko07 = DSM 16239]QOD90275.1 rhomboid family intramembrane serine protease [Lysobacter sp. CW239]